MNEVVAVPSVDSKRAQSETLLADVFKLMDYPAKLEFKDMSDGSLGVAVHFDGELPGITPGKRSYLVDCVQFWLNKVVNRPNVPRRWVNLGINEFPAPRAPGQGPGQPREVPPSAPAAAAPAPKNVAAAPAPANTRAKPAPKPSTPAAPVAQAPKRGRETDERSLTPAADPAITAAGKLLAEKSAKLGRVYGVMGLTADQRALMLKAAEGVKGVTPKAEGEGHWRRLVMVPEKLTVILKKQVMPDYDDEEEDE
jgi:predicted RNA-binding protein Jag